MFETVNKAYEFLCSKVSKTTEGPDPDNIILILKTQTILYTRHNEGVGEGWGEEGQEVMTPPPLSPVCLMCSAEAVQVLWLPDADKDH